MDANYLHDFPVLTLDYLKDLTTGIYQIGLAPSYVQDKLQREGEEIIEIELLRDQFRVPEPGLLRIRVWSRFRQADKHQLWISYTPDVQNDERMDDDDPPPPIQSYYCTCMSGARTLGTCAHVSSVLWYLGIARNEEMVSYPSNTLLETVKDAAGRPPPRNPD